MYSRKKGAGLLGRLEWLEALHANLEARIDDEMKRPLPDNLLVQKLKRLRVSAKDKIANISGVLRTVNRAHQPDAA